MNKPTLYCLCGLPASGKSTFAKQLSEQQNAIICSSDEIREELYGNINDQEHNQEVFTELHRRIKENLKNGKNAIYDATNINYKKRRAFLSELKNIPCNKVCIIMATPYKECLRRNEERGRTIPYYVISSMYRNWNMPYWFEGWNDIRICYTCEAWNDINKWVESMKDYDQYNPHHSMSLGDHCASVGNLLKGENTLHYAGLVHDCGKPFVQSFIDKNGEETDKASYYNHQHCGAYDSLFFKYPNSVNTLDVSILVNFHMMPYFWESNKEYGEKTKEKYRKLWGDRLFEDVMRLHIADKTAH